MHAITFLSLAILDQSSVGGTEAETTLVESSESARRTILRCTKEIWTITLPSPSPLSSALEETLHHYSLRRINSGYASPLIFGRECSTRGFYNSDDVLSTRIDMKHDSHALVIGLKIWIVAPKSFDLRLIVGLPSCAPKQLRRGQPDQLSIRRRNALQFDQCDSRFFQRRDVAFRAQRARNHII